LKRYILIVRNKGYRPVDRAKLLDGARASGKAVVDVRIGTEHIEFDMLSDSPPVVEGFELLELVDLSTRNVQDATKALEQAVRLFDAERFWESHETLEPVWRMSSNIDRKLFHGLILTAAAFVHLQKGDEIGFESILRRARVLLPEPLGPIRLCISPSLTVRFTPRNICLSTGYWKAR
jgi:hypothetical protein